MPFRVCLPASDPHLDSGAGPRLSGDLWRSGLRHLRQFLQEGRESRWRQSHRRHAAGLIAAYLESAQIPKLQLGAGDNPLSGWLNTDAWPRCPDIAFLDVTRPFPLPDRAMQYVFTEHLIEHLDHSEGMAMIRQCYRVLRPGGRIRIATPNLAQIVSLCGSSDQTALRYLDWSARYNALPDSSQHAALVINHFMRAWGHRLIYDEALLAESLEKAGFGDVAIRQPGRSDDPELIDLERHGSVIGEENNRFETVVLEARKPE